MCSFIRTPPSVSVTYHEGQRAFIRPTCDNWASTLQLSHENILPKSTLENGMSGLHSALPFGLLQVCYVGYDLELEKKLALETTTVMEKYTLPDGRVITIGAERFEAPEVRVGKAGR